MSIDTIDADVTSTSASMIFFFRFIVGMTSMAQDFH